MRALLILTLSLLMSTFCGAQGYYWQSAKKKKFVDKLSVSAGLGGRMFFGDVQNSGSLFNKVNLAFGAQGRYQWKQRLGFTFEAAGWRYRGLKTFAFPGSEMTMTGSIYQGALIAEFDVLKWVDYNKASFYGFDPVVKSNLYVGAGAGGGLFNSSYSSNYVSSQDTIITNFESNSASGFGFYVPVVFGYRYRFTPALHMGFRFQYQLFFTDRLDALERSLDDRMGLFLIQFGYSFGQKKRRQ